MSVLIKGMDMPKNCFECKFCRPKQPYPCHCYAGGFPIKPSETDLRDGLCPLVEVPTPHGRLIDVDKAMNRLPENYDKHDGLRTPEQEGIQ